MRLTETQAKTKQCRIVPAAMIPSAKTGHVVSAGQPEHIAYGFSMCIGSACAHWQWMKPEAPASLAVPAPAPEGYCGFSGKPE